MMLEVPLLQRPLEEEPESARPGARAFQDGRWPLAADPQRDSGRVAVT